jgi:hypothetical protein
MMHQIEEMNILNVGPQNCKKKTLKEKRILFLYFPCFKRYEMREEAKKKLGFEFTNPNCLNDECDKNGVAQNITNDFRVVNLAVIVMNNAATIERVYEMVKKF